MTPNDIKLWDIINSKTLEFNQYQKSDKTPSIICADLKSLINRVAGCKYNSKKWFKA